MLSEQGQKQFARRLRAAYIGKEYIYYVLYLDPEDPEQQLAPMSPNMTEDEVRASAAAGEWPGMADIDQVLLKAREANARKAHSPTLAVIR